MLVPLKLIQPKKENMENTWISSAWKGTRVPSQQRWAGWFETGYQGQLGWLHQKQVRSITPAMSKWYLYYPSRLNKKHQMDLFFASFQWHYQYIHLQKSGYSCILHRITLLQSDIAKFFGAFRGSGTQMPRLTNPIFAFSKTLVLLPISSSKTRRFHNFLELFSSPAVFLCCGSLVRSDVC